MLRIFGLAILVVLLTAQSPAPRLSQQPSAATSQQNVSQKERGTEQVPLIVKVISSEHPQADASQNDAKRLSDLTGDLANYTFGLFIATVVLAVLTAGLVIVGLFQVGDAKKSIAAAAAAAKAAKDQVALGRDEFDATHRPQFRVCFVRQMGQGGIEITFINEGTATGRFIEGRAGIWHLLAGEAFPSPHILGTGNSFSLRTTFAPSAADRTVIQGSQDPFEEGFGGIAHIFGWIVYESTAPIPVRRTTFFGWHTQTGTSEMARVKDSDWNLIQ